MPKYTNKVQLLNEINDEVGFLTSGRTCAQRFIKVMCRNKIEYLNWKESRIRKDKSFDMVPSTKYSPKCPIEKL